MHYNEKHLSPPNVLVKKNRLDPFSSMIAILAAFRSVSPVGSFTFDVSQSMTMAEPSFGIRSGMEQYGSYHHHLVSMVEYLNINLWQARSYRSKQSIQMSAQSFPA